jgi:hypothetical protein
LQEQRAWAADVSLLLVTVKRHLGGGSSKPALVALACIGAAQAIVLQTLASLPSAAWCSYKVGTPAELASYK